MAKSVQLKGVEQLKNLINKKIPVAITNAAKRGLLSVGMDLIKASVDIAPLDTGELVESARLKLGGRTYAKGVRLGENETGIELVDTALDTVQGGEGEKRLRQMTMSVSYRRYDEAGNDIAIQLHEDLLPKGRGPKKVRKVGRSGKFLEIPMNQIMTKKRIFSAIKTEVQAEKLLSQLFNRKK